MIKKRLTLEDLESQYATFCENVKVVKQNTIWRTVFNNITVKKTDENKKETP
jgi:hypothetical protein